MTNAKTLMLAAVAALTIGAGSAMAQTVPSRTGNFWQIPSLNQPRVNHDRIQAGSSDVERGSHMLPFNGDYGDLANPG